MESQPQAAPRRLEEQSFFRRLRHWLGILDPLTVLASDAQIKNALILLQTEERLSPEPSQDAKVADAWRLSVASVHPDTGKIIPFMFRPPAFLPAAAPLIAASLLPHQGTKIAFFCQLFFQSYTAGFNVANGNGTIKVERSQAKQAILLLASISGSTVFGAAPQFIMKQYGLNSPAMQTVFRKIVPVPLFALLSAYNVAVTRMMEFEIGIEVVDKNGNVIGVSSKAGAKAVRETAVSRAVLFGTTALIPTLLLHFLESTRFILRNPLASAPIRHISVVVAFGLMIPVSFSLFPQTGKILRKDLEPGFVSATEEQELYYARGL